MIAEIGLYALILALLLAGLQAVLPLYGAARNRPGAMAVAAPAALGQAGMALVALGALAITFLTSDFSVALVAANSHATEPLLYKLGALWGNHEGSMLLWAVLMAVFGALVALRRTKLPAILASRVLAVQGLIGTALLAYVLLAANPFARRDPAPLNGDGLAAVLQHPGLVLHPPLLYLGLVGLSVPFSFAVAALLAGEAGPAWARWLRPWVAAAWTALSAGIALGAWWAYREPGWGGWWNWDPIENAALLPWLVTTALLHATAISERRDALHGWTVLLALLAFCLALLGTFLNRSGMLASVHAFARAPGTEALVLAILVAAAGGALALFARYAPGLRRGATFAPISREGALLLGNLLLITAAGVVLLGTLYPLLLETVTGQRVSVGTPFFNITVIPLVATVVAVMAVGPLLGWEHGDLTGALGRLKIAVLLAILITTISALRHIAAPVAPLAGIALAAWLGAGTLVELSERLRLFRDPLRLVLRRALRQPGARWGMTLGHLGLAIFIAGAAASASWKQEYLQTLRPGETVAVDRFRIQFDGVDDETGPDYIARRARFTVFSDRREVATLTPALRYYPSTGAETSEAAIRSGLAADLYVVLGEQTGAGAWVSQIYLYPMLSWLWIGAGMMVAGGLAAALGHRLRRVPQPAHRRQPTKGEPPCAKPLL